MREIHLGKNVRDEKEKFSNDAIVSYFFKNDLRRTIAIFGARTSTCSHHVNPSLFPV